MPRHAPRRARVIFHGVADRQITAMTDAELARLDPVLDEIAADPGIGTPRPGSLLREHRRGDARVVYYATALGTIVIVTYLEA